VLWRPAFAGAARPGRYGRLVTGRLRVNPIKCTAHGVCAELLPELIKLDPWGYPIIAQDEVPEELDAHARRAIGSCPTLALLVEKGRD
jgi:ferredoxin